MLNFIISNNTKATILTVILLSGIIGITSPPSTLSAATAEIYQNTICDNINLNLNHVEQIQRQNQGNSKTTDNVQQPSVIEGLNLLDSGGPLSNMEDTFTHANINDESLLNLDRNIVNVCINDNNNFLDTELVGTQEQIEPPPPIPPVDFLDIAVANVDSDNVSILLGDITGSFSMATNFDTGDAPLSVTVADFNVDGELDLAVANIISDNVSILLGNGDGTFNNANHFPAGNSPYSVAVGDFNGDGELDLVTTNEFSLSNSVTILLGNGDGTFDTANSFPVGDRPFSVAAGDFN